MGCPPNRILAWHRVERQGGRASANIEPSLHADPKDAAVEYVFDGPHGEAHLRHDAPTTKVDAFARIVRDNDYEASHVVAIGDSMPEFWAARELGIPVLGIGGEGSDAQFPAGVKTRPSLKTVLELLRIG